MEDRFKKEQIIKSDRYRESRDILSALLFDSKEYTFEEIDSIIKGFNDRVFTERGSEL